MGGCLPSFTSFLESIGKEGCKDDRLWNYFYRDCDNHPRYSFNDAVVEAICLFGLQVQKQIKTSPIWVSIILRRIRARTYLYEQIGRNSQTWRQPSKRTVLFLWNNYTSSTFESKHEDLLITCILFLLSRKLFQNHMPATEMFLYCAHRREER